MQIDHLFLFPFVPPCSRTKLSISSANLHFWELASLMFESLCIYDTSLSHSPFPVCCVISIIHVSEEGGVFFIFLIDVGYRNVADGLKTKARLFIYLHHVLLPRARGMMPVLLSFLHQNMDSAILQFHATF